MKVSVRNTTTGLNVDFYPCLSQEDQLIYKLDAASIVPDNLPTAHKWNLLAERALQLPDNKLFMLGADDMVFESQGWDRALLDHYEKLENKIHVYALQDSRDKDGTPHPIVTREYIEAMGYFIPPIYLHWFVDSWTVAIAKANNCFTHLTDFLLTHDKPSDKGQPDETHSRIREWGWHSRDEFVSKTCKHFLEYEKKRLKFIISNPPPTREQFQALMDSFA